MPARGSLMRWQTSTPYRPKSLFVARLASVHSSSDVYPFFRPTDSLVHDF